MSGPPAGATRRVLQAAAAVGLFTAMNFGWLRSEIVLVAYLVMAVVWPPAVVWRPMKVGAVLRAYLPFAALWLVFLVVYLRVMHAVGLPVAPQPMLQQLAEGSAGGATLLLGIAVMAPLLEEHVFRGYLWGGLRTRLSANTTNVVVAVVFGLFHGWHYALPIAVLGWFFGVLRARHDALLPSVVAHAIHNTLTVVLALVWPGHLDYLYPR